MRWLRHIIGGAKALARGERAERELDEELRACLEAAVEEKMRRGLDREQATRLARLELGLVSVESVKDRVRDVGWETHVESIWQDVRYALRGLRRAPGFTAAAVLTLGIGTGANVGIFSIIDHVLFRLSVAFAGIAILLAAIGLYGVLSYTVAQREREIGVRMALGADAIRIARLVFGQVSRIVVAGVIAGYAAALGLGRLAQSMLFGVEGPALLVMAAATIGVTAIALSAGAIPARRAVRVDPAVTLRAE